MKTKKLLLVALTAVCALLMFSSCGEKNLTPTVLYYYQVGGSLSASHFGTGSSSIGNVGGKYSIGSFQDAITAAIGDYTNTPQDSKVIAACDAVDAKIKADSKVKAKGYVEISRKGFNDSGKSTVLKKYTY